ncbi:MAG: hypothetical protein J7K40_03040 [candidate division Zixibacteria bacterium]|nr:hypothetical protein [candidate division Zixibacteria bacterium]
MFNKSLVIILVFAFVCIIQTPAQSQGVFLGTKTNMSLSIYGQGGLPILSGYYQPSGYWVNYTVKFSIDDSQAHDYSVITFSVVEGIDVVVDSRNYPEEGYYTITGSGYTGQGNDYLQIDQTGGNGTDHFGFMKIEAEYLSKPSQ